MSEGSHKKRKGLWFEKWISMVIVYKEMREKLVWHVFFFKVHLLAHQRGNDVGVGVERLCSRLRSRTVPSGVRS